MYFKIYKVIKKLNLYIIFKYFTNCIFYIYKIYKNLQTVQIIYNNF